MGFCIGESDVSVGVGIGGQGPSLFFWPGYLTKKIRIYRVLLLNLLMNHDWVDLDLRFHHLVQLSAAAAEFSSVQAGLDRH